MTVRRAALAAATAILAVAAAVLLGAAPASAHVVPSTVIALDVHERDITARLTLPAGDLATASGLRITEGEPISSVVRVAVARYLERHFHVASDGEQWRVAVGRVGSASVEQWGTGVFSAVTAEVTLTPPHAAQLRGFTVDYDAIVHQVVTADVFVTLHSDWAAGQVESARTLGTIRTDTVTGTVAPLRVQLDSGSGWQGFIGTVALGVSHIAEGTDHQLFLLTLLLPAPLLALGRQWSATPPPRVAIRRILHVTIAFTVGHSTTLALGALGLPVPQRPIEVLIAVSILVAAVHAIRPLFPGREALIAGLFGLVHGMAFSTTLSELDLSGGQLVLSLLGFNLGIELMQLLVICAVLPPLIVLAQTRGYALLRVSSAAVAGIAAIGWALDRIGFPNPIAVQADLLGPVSPVIVGALWVGTVVVLMRSRVRRGREAGVAPRSASAVGIRR